MTPKMLAPITSIKHFAPLTSTTVAAGTVKNHVIVDAVAQPSVAASIDVVEGSIVKAVYCELWIHNNSGSSHGSFTVIIEKIPSNGGLPVLADMTNLTSYQNKKNILYTSQGILGPDDAQGAVPIHRSWVKIPKGKQRFGLGDRFVISVLALDQVYQACGMFLYKEYK